MDGEGRGSDGPGDVLDDVLGAADAGLAKRLLADGRRAEAVPALRRLAAARPAEPGGWKRLAGCLAELGDADGEIAAWRRFLALAPAAPGHAHPADSRLAGLLTVAGRPGEALPHFRALAEASGGEAGPESADAWRQYAKACARAAAAAPAEARPGLHAAEAAAWRRALALALAQGRAAADPAWRAAHVRLAALAELAGRPADAAPHLQHLAEAAPGDLRLWSRLAAARHAARDPEGEAAALQRVIALGDGGFGRRLRLGRLLAELDRPAEAAPHLRAASAIGPAAKAALHLARCLAAIGDPEAVAAWRGVLAADPESLEALEALDRLLAPAPARRSAAGAGLAADQARIVVLGNCQAYVMAQCLRRLLPAAEVRVIGWREIVSLDQARHVAAGLDAYDAVLTQPTETPGHAPLGTAALAARGPSTHFFPQIQFTGFHPDAQVLPARGAPGLVGRWHSGLLLAAWLRGVHRHHVPDLFNAYIYARLGYFDDHDRAVRAHRQAFAALGLDFAPLLSAWSAEGPFVHLPNHPMVRVVWSLAEDACRRIGLDPDPGAVPPPDPLLRFAAWPVYPEIARRLGVPGSLRFVLPAGAPRRRTLDLPQLVRAAWRAYDAADPALLRPRRIQRLAQILKREGV